jgi:hypothetical protein
MRLGSARGKTNPPVFVVRLNQIFNDRPGLPEGDSSIRVVDCGKATVRVDALVSRGLEFTEFDGDRLGREIKLRQDYGYFEWIRCE